MRNYKTSSNRKVHQRALNAVIRRLNRAIEQDDLWQGRFFVKQEKAAFLPYEDHSGYELYVLLKFCDRKTGQEWYARDSANHWMLWGGSHLFREMNDFIVERVNVWANEKPYAEKYNWIEDKDNRDVYHGFGVKGK